MLLSACREVPPVFLRSIKIGKDAGVIYRQLESITKIAPDNGAGSLREVLLKEFGKEYTAEQDGVPTPPFECRDHKRRLGFDEASNQRPHCLRGEEGVVYGGEENGSGLIG